MIVRIFDVDHGFCAAIHDDSGQTILIDCGHNAGTGFRPSNYLRTLGIQQVDALIVSNYDEDHLSDLPNLIRDVYVRTLVANESLPPAVLRRMKEEGGGVSNAMEALLSLRSPGMVALRPSDPNAILARAGLACYWMSYPAFTDTNNLSVVSFLDYGNIRLVIAGDLEREGWEALLRYPEFQERLARSNIFVASHHGRLNGYCREVFDHCHPRIILMSDSDIRHGTQDTNALYAQHAAGVYFGTRLRSVLTTRNDGPIQIQEPATGYPGALISIP